MKWGFFGIFLKIIYYWHFDFSSFPFSTNWISVCLKISENNLWDCFCRCSFCLLAHCLFFSAISMWMCFVYACIYCMYVRRREVFNPITKNSASAGNKVLPDLHVYWQFPLQRDALIETANIFFVNAVWKKISFWIFTRLL